MSSSVVGALRVSLGLDKARFSRGIRETEGEISAFRGRLVRMAAGLAGIFAGALTIRGAAGMADQWSDLSSQVGNTIGSMERAPEVMSRISDMARQSYSDLGMTARAFLANSTALGDLGYSTAQQLDYTEALNNALVISAARGQHAAQVQDALSKAMATGKLSGDGLNTVLARGGRVAQALADELGTTQSGLRRLGSEGRITADVIARALLSSMEQLRDEAGEMPATISDGLTLIRNVALEAVGVFDQLLGASGGIGNALVAVADAARAAVRLLADNADTVVLVLNTLLASGGIVAAFFAGHYAISIGVTAVKAMISAVNASIALEVALGAQSRAAAVAGVATKALSGALALLRTAIIATGIGALVVGAGFLIAKFVELAQKTGGFGNALTALGDLAGLVWQGMIDSSAAIPPALQGTWSAIKADFATTVADMAALWVKFLDSIIADVGKIELLSWGDGEDKVTLWEIDNPLIGSLRDARDSAADLADDMRDSAETAADAASDAFAAAGGIISTAFAPVADAWRKLNGTVEDVEETAPPATEAITDLGEAAGAAGGKAADAKDKFSDLQKVLKGLREEAAELQATMNMSDVDAAVWKNLREAGVGANSAAGREIEGLTRATEGMKTLKGATEDWKKSLGEGFRELSRHGSSFSDVLSGILAKLSDMLWSQGFETLWNGTGAGGILGGALSWLGIGANANGTGNWRGGWTRINERGGEIANLPGGTQIIPHDISKRMADAASQSNDFHVTASFDQEGQAIIKSVIRTEARGAATAAVGASNRQAVDRRYRYEGR